MYGRQIASHRETYVFFSCNGRYAATVSIFIHTLKFKGYIGPITAMVAYDVIIPGFLFLCACPPRKSAEVMHSPLLSLLSRPCL